jgi:hypothetical protein
VLQDSQHVSNMQYESYLNYLSEQKESFQVLCSKLNNMEGSKKTVSQWQKTFWNWIYSTKRKARKMFVHRYVTGGGSPICIILTHLEERLLQIIGQLTVNGLKVHELGLKIHSPKIQKKINKNIRYPIYKKMKRIRYTKMEKNVTQCFVKNSKMYATGLFNFIEALLEFKHAVIRLIKLL